MSRTRLLMIIVGLVLIYTGYIKRPEAPKIEKPHCVAFVGAKQFNCSFGRSGVVADKKEGDGATPLGTFPLRRVFYRADQIKRSEISTLLPLQALTPEDAWIDDSNSPYYNQYSRLPTPYSHEDLWRRDDVYNLVVVVGYNDQPAIKGKGSAIFLHIARPNYAPTAGCIAFSKNDLLEILKFIKANTQIEIHTNGHIYFYDKKPSKRLLRDL